jgi:hypothetical protein
MRLLLRRVTCFASGYDLLAVFLLVLWPFVYFLPVTLGQGVWLNTDIVRFSYPAGVELARALNEGHLPLWTTRLQSGFPLFAEGQVGALYPLYLVLFRFLPAHLAVSYGILLHLAWAGAGMYTFVRSQKLSVASALLAGFVFSFNGIMIGHLVHPLIVAGISWLPWLLFLQMKFQTAQRTSIALLWFALAALAMGVLMLGAHPQFAFLDVLAVSLFGVFGNWLWSRTNFAGFSEAVRALSRNVFRTVALLALAGGIAAIQLIPMAELMGYSLRGSDLGQDFLTAFSLSPAYLAQFVFPFAQDQPTAYHLEFYAYFGIVPFVLTCVVLFLRRDRKTVLFFAFCLGALSLALGKTNPLYPLLTRLPLFSSFRAPARYLYLAVFCASFLGAYAFEELKRNLGHGNKMVYWVITAILPIIAALVLSYEWSYRVWLDVWQVLPGLFAILAVAAIALAWSKKVRREVWVASTIGFAVFDLTCYAAPFMTLLNPITPMADVEPVPSPISALETNLPLGRFFTDLTTYHRLPALFGSLFPNTALIYGGEGTQVYSPLEFARHVRYESSPSSLMFNLMNVKYYMVPLQPGLPEQAITPDSALILDILNKEVRIAPTTASFIELTSFIEQATGFPEGALIGEMSVHFEDGGVENFPLRAGIETAEWDYDLKNADGHLGYASPTIAHSFPAYWYPSGRSFDGHTYLARFDLTSVRDTSNVIGIGVRVLQPDAGLVIESTSLVEPGGYSASLATLAHRSNFRLAYRSDAVIAWRNLDMIQRAFIVHTAEVMNDDAAFARLRDTSFDATQTVLLGEGEGAQLANSSGEEQDQVDIKDYQSDRVILSVTTSQPGFLVLLDSWYPGWNAFIDGQSAPIYRADILFRALRIEPGTHTVVFEYRPMSFAAGAVISMTSLLIVLGMAVYPRLMG